MMMKLLAVRNGPGMDAAPQGSYDLAGRRQFNDIDWLSIAPHLLHDARQYRPSSSHAESEKKESPPALIELQSHAPCLLQTSTGGSFPRAPSTAPIPHLAVACVPSAS